LVQGDSYSNDNADFPNLLNNLGEIVVRSVGVSGATIHGVLEPAFAAGLAADYYDCVILQGGVNDINTSVTLANLKTAQISRIEKSLAAGCHLIVLDVAPYITFNTNPVKLLMWEQYNTWLENYCVSNGITLLKISNLLADPTNRYVINPIYQVSGESPNFLHVNEAGALAIANAIYSELLAINAG
jgi:lysophospholipase L1-like esterase